MMYTPKWFSLYELVPHDIFEARGGAAWELLDPGLLVTLDALRAQFGKVKVNDWYWDGGYSLSGFRPPWSNVGADLSQHRFGRAADCKFDLVTPREAYEYIRARAEQFPHITVLEDIEATPTWLHFDVRNTPVHDGIRIVRP